MTQLRALDLFCKAGGAGTMSETVYLCDIDGTIADISHRLHFIQDEFHKAADAILALKGSR